MNNKKSKIVMLVAIIELIIIIVLSVVEIIVPNVKKEDGNYIFLKSYEVSELRKIDYELPDFTIVVTGIYDGTITNIDLEKNDIPVYEFDAGMQTSWAIMTDRYVGVKLVDVFDTLGLTNFKDVKMYAPGKIELTYDAEEIDDKMFFVFERAGEPIGEANVSLLATQYDYNYSVENLVKLTFE